MTWVRHVEARREFYYNLVQMYSEGIILGYSGDYTQGWWVGGGINDNYLKLLLGNREESSSNKVFWWIIFTKVFEYNCVKQDYLKKMRIL